MWIFLALLLLLLLLISWLLWARLVVCVNSYQRRYFVSFGGLITVKPVSNDQEFLLEVKLPFYRFQVDPFEKRSEKSKAKKKDKPATKKKSPREKGRQLNFAFYLKAGIDALKTFTVKRLKLDVDTGDFVLNAKLTPVVVLLSRGPAEVQVNYMGRTDIWIEIEHQLVRLVPLVIRFVRKKYL